MPDIEAVTMPIVSAGISESVVTLSAKPGQEF